MLKMKSSELFKILSVDTRVKIIELLKSDGPLGTKEIAENIGITTAAVSQHLKILKLAGLVNNERKGYWIPYSIDEEAMENCRQTLNDVCTCGCKETQIQNHLPLNEPLSDDLDLTTLKKYEKQLESELQAVRQKSKELESKKG